MENRIVKVIASCTSNNTILHASLSSMCNLIISTGKVGFKGAKRSTKFAAQRAAEVLGEKLIEKQVKNIILIFKGFGKGRKSILKGLKQQQIVIRKLIDKTPQAHNGCRAKKNDDYNVNRRNDRVDKGGRL